MTFGRLDQAKKPWPRDRTAPQAPSLAAVSYSLRGCQHAEDALLA